MNRIAFATTLKGLFGSISRYVAFMQQHRNYAVQAQCLADDATSEQNARDIAAEWFRYRVIPQLADDARTRRKQKSQQKSLFDI